MSKWKGFEQFIARQFNTVRTPFSGSNSGITHSDSLHDRIYVECKDHQNQAVLTLMKDTEELAKKENKTPIVCLADPTDVTKSKYVMFNIKDLFKIVREIDLHELDKRLPEHTTIYKLIETSSSENRSLFELKEEFTIQIKQIMRNKTISNDDLEGLKTLSTLLYFIDHIIDYSKEVEDGPETPEKS